MTALGDFSAGDVLTAADLNAIGTWTSFTPTIQFTSLGNGSAVGVYCQINGLVFIRGEITIGSTSVISSGFSIEAPVAADSTGGINIWGSCIYADASSGLEYPGSMVSYGINRLRFYVWTSSTNWTVTSATSPFTWATGDLVRFEGMYKAA